MGRALTTMSVISSRALALTGIFRSKLPVQRSVESSGDQDTPGGLYDFASQPFEGYTLQRGVVRTNCLDCMDRTNIAQFLYGKSALAHQVHLASILPHDLTVTSFISPQLYALGVFAQPSFVGQEDIIQTLMDLYDDMGDTIALQVFFFHTFYSLALFMLNSVHSMAALEQSVLVCIIVASAGISFPTFVDSTATTSWILKNRRP